MLQGVALESTPQHLGFRRLLLPILDKGRRANGKASALSRQRRGRVFRRRSGNPHSASLDSLAGACPQPSLSAALPPRLLGKRQRQLFSQSFHTRLFHNRRRLLAVESPSKCLARGYGLALCFFAASLRGRSLSHRRVIFLSSGDRGAYRDVELAGSCRGAGLDTPSEITSSLPRLNLFPLGVRTWRGISKRRRA